MKKKEIYQALGLMSGTSMDGVDASIVHSKDGTFIDSPFNFYNKYFKYDKDLRLKLTNLRNKINSSNDLKKYSNELKLLEKEITLFHAKVVNEMIKSKPKEYEPNLIGFHGQTIFHNPDEKISIQLGDGKLLSQLTKKTVVYNFRENDLKNGGGGAPLTAIFHNCMVNRHFQKKWPILVLNIGGIANLTSTTIYPLPEVEGSEKKREARLFAADIGPGNCLIDEWIRKNSKYEYDAGGLIAKSGKVNELILNQSLENFGRSYKKSFDIKDFDISFVRDLSLEDGAATLTHFTAKLMSNGLDSIMKAYDCGDVISKALCYVCGGGRKNNYLMDLLKQNLNLKDFASIDDVGIDGDFVESLAFGYLAIKSYLGLPISFPNTTGCKEPSTGGVIVRSF